MNKNLAVILILFASVGAIITGFLTESWLYSSIIFLALLVLGIWFSRRRIFLTLFFVCISPLLTSLTYQLNIQTENFNFQVALKELNTIPSWILGICSILCLFFFFLERNGAIKNPLLSSKKNSIGDVTGNNSSINQSID